MGTNYYATIIPTKKRIHLGKRSAGWKFLWNPNWWENKNINRFIEFGDEPIIKYYDLTKESILEFLTSPLVVIHDEYGEIEPPLEFFNMAVNWCPGGYDYQSYYKNHPEERKFFRSDEEAYWNSLGFHNDSLEFYSDGLRFSCCMEFS